MSLLSSSLEAFTAVVNHRTVHAAAKHLFLTQTAVTQRIKTLESKLGTTLFIRRRSGMTLTQEGKALLNYCRAAMHLEKQTMSHIQEAAIEESIQLTVTGPSSLMSSRIVPNCLPIMKAYPKLLLNFLHDDVEHRHELLKNGISDISIILAEQALPEFETKALQSEQYVLVCSQKWKHRTLEDIISNEHIIDFNPSDQVSFNYLKKYELLQYAKKERYFANRTQALASLIVNQFGYGLLAREFTQPYVDSDELMILNDDKALEHSYYLAWYARPEMPTYFQKLLDVLN